MGIFSMLSGPVIGAVIGYITNDIAIRMLFRPHKAVYVLGHRLPFTPGIVPRRKNELAQILGDAIVAKFFNADDLEIVFTSGIADSVADRVTALLRSEATLEIFTAELPEDTLDHLEAELCIRIQAAVCTSDLPEVFAKQGGRMVSNLLSRSNLAHSVAQGIVESYSRTVSHEIEEFIIEHGFELIMPLLKKEVDKAVNQPISELTSLVYGEDDSALREAIKRLYLRFMAIHVRPIVESIDVGGMITEKIILMTSEEVEDLVLTVVKRELRLVVLFGAFVGAIIGTVNAFI